MLVADASLALHQRASATEAADGALALLHNVHSTSSTFADSELSKQIHLLLSLLY